MDIRQSKEYCQFMRSMGWKVEKGVFLKKLPLLPYYFAKLQRPGSRINFQELEWLKNKYKVVLFKIELGFKASNLMLASLKTKGYRQDKSPMLPSKTVVLDLNKSLGALLKEMHHKTRYNLKKYKHKIELIRGDKVSKEDLDDFYKIYQKNYKKQGFWGLSKSHIYKLISSFGGKAHLIGARKQGWLLLLISGNTGYYSHNGSSVEGRKNFVPTLLAWEAIKLAKKESCTRFDFEGIEDDRYPVTKKWRGFSRFKKSFGGEVLECKGSYSKFSFY